MAKIERHTPIFLGYESEPLFDLVTDVTSGRMRLMPAKRADGTIEPVEQFCQRVRRIVEGAVPTTGWDDK